MGNTARLVGQGAGPGKVETVFQKTCWRLLPGGPQSTGHFKEANHVEP